MKPRMMSIGAAAFMTATALLVAALAARQVAFQEQYSGWKYSDRDRIALFRALVAAGLFTESRGHAVLSARRFGELTRGAVDCWPAPSASCGLAPALTRLLRSEGFVKAGGPAGALDHEALRNEIARNLDNLEALDDGTIRVRTERFSRGLPSSVATEPGRVLGRNNETLAASRPTDNGIRTTTRIYPLGAAGFAVLGSAGLGGSGLERVARAHLLGGGPGSVGLLPARYFPPAGRDLRVTISGRLQRAAYSVLERPGAVVILDARTGAILAAASAPSVDPETLTRASYQALERDESQPLLNRALDRTYPPGSTFKLVVMAAALNDPERRVQSLHVDCDGRGANGIRCPHAHGRVTFARALSVSCNAFFARAAELLGKRVRDEALRLGFGEPPEPLLDEDLTGRPYRAATSQAYDVVDDAGRITRPFNFRSATPRMLGMCGIGQQCVAATPLEIASLTQIVAARGLRARPTLDGASRPRLERRMDPIVASEIRVQMEDAWTSGTARELPRIRLTGGRYRVGENEGISVRVAAKTGTAEVIWEEGGRLLSLPPHSWFTAFAPADHPRVVVTVMIEHGGWGASAAGLRAVRLLAEALDETSPGEE